jgi:tetratricopeptide (TPR) repeat protein
MSLFINIKICDFGRGQVDDSVYSFDTVLTPVLPAGTERFRPPEQCGAHPYVTQKSDMYSVGRVVVELLNVIATHHKWKFSARYDADNSDFFEWLSTCLVEEAAVHEKQTAHLVGASLASLLQMALECDSNDRVDLATAFSAMTEICVRENDSLYMKPLDLRFLFWSEVFFSKSLDTSILTELKICDKGGWSLAGGEQCSELDDERAPSAVVERLQSRSRYVCALKFREDRRDVSEQNQGELEREYKQELLQYPTDGRLLLSYGMFLAHVGRHDDATTQLEAALRHLHPDNAVYGDVLVALGKHLLKRGTDLERAQRLLGEACDRDGAGVDTVLVLARFLATAPEPYNDFARVTSMLSDLELETPLQQLERASLLQSVGVADALSDFVTAHPEMSLARAGYWRHLINCERFVEAKAQAVLLSNLDPAHAADVTEKWLMEAANKLVRAGNVYVDGSPAAVALAALKQGLADYGGMSGMTEHELGVLGKLVVTSENERAQCEQYKPLLVRFFGAAVVRDKLWPNVEFRGQLVELVFASNADDYEEGADDDEARVFVMILLACKVCDAENDPRISKILETVFVPLGEDFVNKFWMLMEMGGGGEFFTYLKAMKTLRQTRGDLGLSIALLLPGI